MTLIELIKDNLKAEEKNLLIHLNFTKTNDEIIESMKLSSLINFDIDHEDQENKQN